MEPELLSSATNPHLKQVRRWRDSAQRCRADGVLLAEGVHLVDEALSAGIRCLHLFVTDGAEREDIRRLTAEAARRGAAVRFVLPRLFPSISTLDAPQGILGVFARPLPRVESTVTDAPHILVAAGIQDPGNLGSILRSARATGIRELHTTRGTVDAYHHRTLRASAGAAFHLGIHPEAEPGALLARLRSRGRRLLALVPDAPTSLLEVDPFPPSAVVFGAEGQGIPPEIEAALDLRVRIPMEPGVESLAVPAAAVVVFYWLYLAGSLTGGARET